MQGLTSCAPILLQMQSISLTLMLWLARHNIETLS